MRLSELFYAFMLVVLPNYAMCEVHNITNVEDFDTKVLQSEKPVVVAFTSADCGEPCQEMGKIIQKASVDDGVDFFTVDVDEAPDVAEAQNVQKTPMEIFYKEGKEANRASGPLVMDGLLKIINEVEYL